MKSLVTGGAGFIGSHLSRTLLREGHEVVAVDNLSTGSSANLDDIINEICFIRGDIRDGTLVKRLLRGVDFVFHQAALPSVRRSVDDPWATNDHNVNGTLNLLLASRDAGVRRFIYAASSSAYGETAGLPRKESMPASPLSPYALSKYTGELYCQVFNKVYGLETVCLRYFNVFGPRQDPNSHYAAVIPRFIKALMYGESPVVFGDGKQTRDFTYVDDVVTANILACKAPQKIVAGEVFNIGCGQRVSINRLLEELQVIMGTSIEPSYAEPRPGDVRDSQADISKARKLLGYQPKVELTEGLDLTVAWFSANMQTERWTGNHRASVRM